MSLSGSHAKIPVLLLKTKSAPHDGYEEYFSTASNGGFEPTFVPVLEHRFRSHSLDRIKQWLTGRPETMTSDSRSKLPYGGIIFTSQRAVEAFSQIVTRLRDSEHGVTAALDSSFPLYVVGPATARGLRSIQLPCAITGGESGNGEALAHVILKDYITRPQGQGLSKLPLLFLVGEQRRDVIPNTLQSEALSDSERVRVDELVIYETGEMHSFRDDFTAVWTSHGAARREQWVIVFSPQGCKAMLDTLGLCNAPNGKLDENVTNLRNTYIATIGPTTRDYLIKEFGFHPDVCAPKPSPEGVGDAIRDYMRRRTPHGVTPLP